MKQGEARFRAHTLRVQNSNFFLVPLEKVGMEKQPFSGFASVMAIFTPSGFFR